jgi:hypothetical protein
LAPEDEVVRHLGFGSDSDLPEPLGVRWFHATRALEGTTFAEGLLPTLQALPKLWDCLGRIAERWTSPAEWIEYQRSFEKGDRHFAKQFHRKQEFDEWEGPFAFLVRDAALGRHGGHRTFTAMSEAAEDVCGDYEEVFGHPLAAAYRAATRPCLVVFTTPGPHPRTVRAALNYAHREVCGIEHGLSSNWCFAGKGTAVPPDWLDRVEWLDDTETPS